MMVKVLTNVSMKLEAELDREEIVSLKSRKRAKEYEGFLQGIYEDTLYGIMQEAEPGGRLRNAGIRFCTDQERYGEIRKMKGCGFGAVDPDGIREAVLSWNKELHTRLIRCMEAFEAEAVKRELSKVSDLLAASADKDWQIQWDKFPYPARPFHLMTAMAAANNEFTYGQDRFYYSPESPLPGVFSYVPHHVIATAAVFPEDLLILELEYEEGR